MRNSSQLCERERVVIKTDCTEVTGVDEIGLARIIDSVDREHATDR